MDDPYKTLGVSRKSSPDEIRKAYRKLAKELHPDAKPGDKAAEERFKHVSQAFNVLSDKKKKAEFDSGGFNGMGAGGPHGAGMGRNGPFNFRQGRPGSRDPNNMGDIFSDLFSDIGAQSRTPPPRGQDVKHRLSVEFMDAAMGGKHRITLTSGKAVDVAVPPGATNGQILRLRGQGEASRARGTVGDALVELHILPHRYFSRDDLDVRLDLPISLSEAVLGAKVRVPTIDGPVDVRVPVGSTSGGLLRLRNKGFAGSKGKRGDQIIRLLVALPEGDTSLKEFLETWKPPAGYNPRKGMNS